MRTVIKVKLYMRRTKSQLLKRALENARFVWNKLLEMRREKYLWEFEMNRTMRNFLRSMLESFSHPTHKLPNESR